MTLGLIAIASIGKFTGAFVGGEIGGLTRREAFALACGMNARGSTEVIVATIGLSMGALTQNLFTMIVTMAVVTTMAMPPMLRFALARVPMSRSERERLEREEQEAKGFVANLERLLVAIDDSANGRFAARLAGLLAGSRGLATTVLTLSAAQDKDKDKHEDTSADRAEQTVKAAAQDAAQDSAQNSAKDTGRVETKQDEPEPVDVVVRRHAVPRAEAVAREAKKGYGLLVVGVANTRARNGAFHRDVARIAASFDGPIAIVRGNEEQLRDPEQSPLDILVPVNGTEVSRRAAEVAVAIAHSSGCAIAALSVSTTTPSRNRPRSRARQEQQAIVKDIAAMADRQDVEIKTAVRADSAPADAILAEAEKADEGLLIIMGVSRRPGDSLSFGDTAAAVLEHAPGSVLFVAS
jgi:nucleotide-binding universal stress UspA family protein